MPDLPDQAGKSYHIRHDLKGARQAIFRATESSCSMMDLDLHDAIAELPSQGGQVTVHTRAQVKGFDHRRAEDLQRASIVVQPHAAHPTEQRVRYHRRDVSGKKRVLALSTPANHDVVATGEHQHPRNVPRIVLQIPIARYDEFAQGGRKPGRKRGGLAEIPNEPDDAHSGVSALDRLQTGECPVLTPIVDQHDFIRPMKPGEHLRQLCMKRVDIGLLIPKRDDDRELWNDGRGHRTQRQAAENRRRHTNHATAAARMTATRPRATVRPCVRMSVIAVSP